MQAKCRRHASSRAARKSLRTGTKRTSLLDHFIRPHQEQGRDGQAEGVCSLQVDGEIEVCGSLDGEISRLGALEDLVDVGSGPTVLLGLIWPVGHQQAFPSQLREQR